MRMPGYTRFGTAGVVILAMALAVVPAAEAIKLRVLPGIYTDQRGGGLRRPEGVGCGAGSILVVADTGNGRLLRYRIADDSVTPETEIVLPQIPYPIQVQVSTTGQIFALDGRLRRIAKLSPEGLFLEYVQAIENAAPGPSVPRAIRLDGDDNLHVLDIHHATIYVLDSSGGLQRKISIPAETGSIMDIAVDSGGTVFALDTTGRRVFVARKGDESLSALTGAMPEDFAFPTSLAVDSQGRLFIADENEGGIVILGSDGSFRGRQAGRGWQEGELRYPSGLCATDQGMLFVADRDNNRLQVFAVAE